MYRTLQTGRAFAALLVVLCHLGGTISLNKYFGIPWMARPFSFGHAGVHFFFVLSGFIIVHVHWPDIGRPARLWTYVKKRVLRIYPVYWVVFCCVALALLPVAALRETLPTNVGVLLKALLLLPQNPNVAAGVPPLLVVSWTLQYEVLFYAFMAAFIASRVVGVALLVSVLALYLFQPFGNGYPLEFMQSDWMLLFLLGATVAAINRASVRLPWPLLWAAAGFALFIGNGLREVFEPAFQSSTSSLLIYGVGSALMILGLVRAEAAGQADIFKSKATLLLGDASYALYLIHFPLISVICKVAHASGLRGASGAAATYLIGLVACLTVSVIFHLRIEKPLLRNLGKLVLRKTLAGQSP